MMRRSSSVRVGWFELVTKAIFFMEGCSQEWEGNSIGKWGLRDGRCYRSGPTRLDR
jgi:hypothetical protein